MFKIQTKSITWEQVTDVKCHFVSFEFNPNTGLKLRLFVQVSHNRCPRSFVFGVSWTRMETSSAPVSSTNKGSADKNMLPSHFMVLCNFNWELKQPLKKKIFVLYIKVVCYTKCKALQIWLDKREEWISCRENVLQSSFVDFEQQQH